MKVLFDHEIIEENLTLSVGDRALQYGDGLFETIAVENKEPKYLHYHIERLIKGAGVLNLTLPGLDWQAIIDTLLSANKTTEASVKLMVWRKPTTAKGFGFDNTECHFMLCCRAAGNKMSEVQQAGFAETVRFSFSELSAIKTLNALPYILAANERQKRRLDELIVLNRQGHICECVSSNVFWMKDDEYFTPPIESGCLEGVTRRVMIETLKDKGKPVNEVMAAPHEMLAADAVFTTNSSGIRFIKQIDQHTFDTSLKSDPIFLI